MHPAATHDNLPENNATTLSARKLYRRFVRLYVMGSVIAVSITLLLVWLGLGFTAYQWLYFLYATTIAVTTFVVADIYALNRHFRPLRDTILKLEKDGRLDEHSASAGVVQALNMPYLSFIRVTFLHTPLAAGLTVLACFVGNAFFDTGFQQWQIWTFGATIAFFAAPSHAIFEYFITARDMGPVIDEFWRYGKRIKPEHQKNIIHIRLRNKLLYLSIFIASLPLIYFAATILLKVNLLFEEVYYALSLKEMSPLIIWVVGVVITCLIGALIMAVMTSLEVSRNAQKLINAMHAVEVGELDSTLKITTTDEYAELFRGFNLMTESLQEEVHILEISKKLAGELNLDVLLMRIISATTELLDADRSTLMIYDSHKNELFSRLAQGLDITEIRIPADQGIAGSVFMKGEPENIPDVYEDERFNQDVDKQTGYRTRSMLCMPIVNKAGEKLGVTQVLNKHGGVFTKRDENRLAAFTAQISVALENARLFEDVLNEKKLNDAIQKSSSSAIITMDAFKHIITVNEAAEKLLRLKHEELVGLRATTLFSRNDWILNSIDNVKKTGKKEELLDVEMLVVGEEKASVNMSAMPLIDANNDTIGSMLVFDDISSEKRMRSTMSRHLSAEVVDELLKSGEEELGGKGQNVTILFSDLRSFTTISEQLGPRGTVTMLNEYFERMVDVIMDNRGVLDKYIGDAIMAEYGVPFGGEFDADNAVKTANGMFRALSELNALRVEEKQMPLDIGVGVSTGDVIVGNIGSPKRVEYTVIGDAVNLASRLEGVTKQYGAKVLISEYTMNELQDDYILREMDVIRVKGQNKPVSIYESLDHYTPDVFPNMHKVINTYLGAYKAMRQRNWSQAEKGFVEALEFHANDKPSQTHLERVRHYMDNPPPDDWDGVWDMKTK